MVKCEYLRIAFFKEMHKEKSKRIQIREAMQKSQVNIFDQEQLKKESREQDLSVSDLWIARESFSFLKNMIYA